MASATVLTVSLSPNRVCRASHHLANSRVSVSPFYSTISVSFSTAFSSRCGSLRLWSSASPSSSSPPRSFSGQSMTLQMPSLPLGSPPPDFELLDPLSGKIWKLEDFKDVTCLWVMFLCNRSRSSSYLKPHLAKLAREYVPKGVGVVAISPSSVIVDPEDGPEQMAAEALKLRYPFPYLYDETQEVSRAFGPICIPDFFVFKKDEGKSFELVYHGQIDDSRSINSRPITYRDIKEALDAVLDGRPVNSVQTPCSGCAVKWFLQESVTNY